VIETFKMATGKYDSAADPNMLELGPFSLTRGQDLRLQKNRTKYN